MRAEMILVLMLVVVDVLSVGCVAVDLWRGRVCDCAIDDHIKQLHGEHHIAGTVSTLERSIPVGSFTRPFRVMGAPFIVKVVPSPSFGVP